MKFGFASDRMTNAMIEYEPPNSVEELLEDIDDILAIVRAKLEDAGKPRVPLEEIMRRFGMIDNE